MRVFLKQTAVGPQGSFLGQREYDVPGEMPVDMAKILVSANYARWVDGPPKVEAAVERPPENAAERTLPPWTMKVAPSDYLERWPDGPKADLARAHLEG